MVFILVILALVVLFAFSSSTNRTRREKELLYSYYRLAGALDITKFEADSFMGELAKEKALPQCAELYRLAINELRSRVTVPRSLSGDHRSLISIKSTNG